MCGKPVCDDVCVGHRGIPHSFDSLLSGKESNGTLEKNRVLGGDWALGKRVGWAIFAAGAEHTDVGHSEMLPKCLDIHILVQSAVQ